MSTDPQSGGAPPNPEDMTPEQQEMMRQMEEEMRQVRVQDLLTQSVVSLLNLAARRIAKDDERDLEQGKLGIDAVRALVGMLEEGPQEEVRNALSQIQMLYSQHSSGGGPPEGPGAGGGEPGGPAGGGSGSGGGEGTQKPPSGLWTPGS